MALIFHMFSRVTTKDSHDKVPIPGAGGHGRKIRSRTIQLLGRDGEGRGNGKRPLAQRRFHDIEGGPEAEWRVLRDRSRMRERLGGQEAEGTRGMPGMRRGGWLGIHDREGQGDRPRWELRLPEAARLAAREQSGPGHNHGIHVLLGGSPGLPLGPEPPLAEGRRHHRDWHRPLRREPSQHFVARLSRGPDGHDFDPGVG